MLKALDKPWRDFFADEFEKRAMPASRTDPFSDDWDFLSRAVWTQDEAARQIRQFPAALMHDGEPQFDYLRYLTGERRKYRVRAYEKSRRMLITWWLLALYLRDLMTEKQSLAAVASDKLQKSAYLLGPSRMQLIYDLIPPVTAPVEERLRALGYEIEPFKADIWPGKPRVTFEQKEGEGWRLAKCEATGSTIMAVASGETQMQQYTFSRILMDEFSRWRQARDSWRNAQPTTQGGGEVDIVCTAELGSFAYDLLYDKVGI